MSYEEKKTEHLAEYLSTLGACSEAINWAGQRHVSRTAYHACRRGDWLLWLAVRAGIDRRLVVLAACDCAEPVLDYVSDGEDRPRVTIKVTRAWCHGNATKDDVRRVASVVHDVYWATSDATSNAAFAAYAAAYAAYVARYATGDSAAVVSYAALDAAEVAYTSNCREIDANKSLALSARLVRKRIPWGSMWEAIVERRSKND